jgi:two-component system, NarL family, sensor kinase
MRIRLQLTNLLGIILLLWTNTLTAQPDFYQKAFIHDRDSLIKELAKYPNPDTARALALVNILDAATFLSQKRQVMPYYQEAAHLSRQLKFNKAEAIYLEWMGGFYKSQRKADSALIYLDSSILATGNSADILIRRTRGLALFQKAMISEGQENLYTALNCYFLSLKCYDSTDLEKQKYSLLRIAAVYARLLNNEKALEYYNASLQLYYKMKGPVVTPEAEEIYTYIANIYYKMGDMDKAKAWLTKMQPAMPDTVETMVTGGYYHLAGQIALKQHNTDSSILYLTRSLKYYDYTRQMHTDVIANVCADIARLKLATGRLPEAQDYARKSFVAANESHQNEALANSLIVMAEYYNRTGNQSAAYEALRRATILNDSALTEANTRQANTLAAIYENDKKEKAIATLEIDKKTQAAEVKQTAYLNTIFIITILALLLISGVLVLNFRNKQKIERQKIAELEKEKQLMGIEAMLKGQEKERTRLAQDLHDGLGSMLSGVKISFSTMKENIIMDAASAKAFEKSIDQLDRTIAELRKVAHNLMPEALVRFGLKSAVKDFCESIQLSGNLEIICEQFGTDRELGNIADVNVYRIIQELINNAVTHGKASQVLVQLTRTDDDKVLITVEDNGKGFDPAELEKASGMGWANIRSRVNYFNGLVEITSKPGQGTTINIEIVA